MQRKLLILGSTLGLLAVILGAFGAHGLKQVLSSEAINTFEVGVRYQFYHALLAMLIGGFSIFSEKLKKIVYWLIFSGVSLFSGSIYLLSMSDFVGVSFKKIAFLTPIGGVLLICAWAIIVGKLLKMKGK